MSEYEPESNNILPLIGDMAPKFTAQTTNGPINFQSSLKEFQKLNTELIGLSVDGNPSHLAWFRSIYNEINFKDWKNVEITFPVIADINSHVAKLYGMIHPHASETTTVRAVFIIDPHGIIRTILYYPQTTGRNIEEILRILTALQTHDAFGVSTPANWTIGAPVIEPVPQTNKDMHKRINTHDKDINMLTWYLAFRDLSESKIHEKLDKNQKK